MISTQLFIYFNSATALKKTNLNTIFDQKKNINPQNLRKKYILTFPSVVDVQNFNFKSLLFTSFDLSFRRSIFFFNFLLFVIRE
jgi:hypothetical protein